MRLYLTLMMAVSYCNAGCKVKVPEGVADEKIVPSNVRDIAIYRSGGVYRSGIDMSKMKFSISDPKIIRKLASLIDFSRPVQGVECKLDAQLFIRLKSANVYVDHLITDGWRFISRSRGSLECWKSFRITEKGRLFLKERAQDW